jgi:hypothetical protein
MGSHDTESDRHPTTAPTPIPAVDIAGHDRGMTHHRINAQNGDESDHRKRFSRYLDA